MGDLSMHFSRKELECPCCGKFIKCPPLYVALERIRAGVGGPMIVASGTRCAKHNREVRGRDDSRHLVGAAADVIARGAAGRWLVLFSVIVGLGRNLDVGVYPGRGGVHIGIKPGGPFLWAKRGGVFIPIGEGIEQMVRDGTW